MYISIKFIFRYLKYNFNIEEIGYPFVDLKMKDKWFIQFLNLKSEMLTMITLILVDTDSIVDDQVVHNRIKKVV